MKRRYNRTIVLGLSIWLTSMTAGCLEFNDSESSTNASEPATAEVNTSTKTPTNRSLTFTPPDVADTVVQLPNDAWVMSFAKQVPIQFVVRSKAMGEWNQLPTFWNEGFKEKVRDPRTGQEVERSVVKIKVPLGLTQDVPVPDENPITVAKFVLGKKLYFDPILSTDGKVSCATCHDPAKGFTDQLPVSTGIKGQKGGMSAPTVMNSAYQVMQFWDGRAGSLEEQAQGPVQNPVEMYDDNFGPAEVHAWPQAVERLRKNPMYVQAFKEVFGTLPTRDATAKAIACYERLVLVGNSVHDRAELLMRARVAEEGKATFLVEAVDYEAALQEAIAKKETKLLISLGLSEASDAATIKDTSNRIKNGHTLFFNKARCNTCHAGDNFTDNLFHNLGVGVKEGVVPSIAFGRFAAMPTGHKRPDFVGAFKTPTLRGLLSTAPYLHDGSETTLEAVVDFYDRGGNANEFLDVKMRDIDKEQEYARLGEAAFKAKYKNIKVSIYGDVKKPIIPLELNLTPQEKKDLVIFLKALQGDLVDPMVADPKVFP